MADLIIKFVVSPALTCGSPISYVEEISQDAEEKCIAILKIVPSLDKVNNLPPLASSVSFGVYSLIYLFLFYFQEENQFH